MGNHTAKYQACIKRKEAKAALAKEASECGRNSGAKGYPDTLKAQRDWPFAEQMDVGEGWNRHPRRVLSGNHQCTPKPNHSPQLVTEPHA